MTPVLWRSIIGMSLFITIMMVLLIIFGAWWFGFTGLVADVETCKTGVYTCDYDDDDNDVNVDECIGEDADAGIYCSEEDDGVFDTTSSFVISDEGAMLDDINKTIMYTIYFNAFIMMHLFNFFNCRKIGAKEYDIFNNLTANWMFAVVILIVGLI